MQSIAGGAFMPEAVTPVPTGYHTVTPYFTIRGASRAIDFYKKAFGATEVYRMEGPQGRVMHAELKIGDSMIMLGDEVPGMGNKSPETLGGTTAGIMLYVDDVDKVFNQAVAAGAKSETPVADQFWGDRYGKLVDPFGHSWSVATHKEDVAPAEMEKRMKEAMAKMAAQAKHA
jgi:PhnB protein